MDPTRLSTRQRNPSAKGKEAMEYNHFTKRHGRAPRAKGSATPAAAKGAVKTTGGAGLSGSGGIPKAVARSPLSDKDEALVKLLLELASAATAPGHTSGQDVDIESLRRDFYASAPKKVAGAGGILSIGKKAAGKSRPAQARKRGVRWGFEARVDESDPPEDTRWKSDRVFIFPPRPKEPRSPGAAKRFADEANAGQGLGSKRRRSNENEPQHKRAKSRARAKGPKPAA